MILLISLLLLFPFFTQAQEDETITPSFTRFKKNHREFVIRPTDGVPLCKEYGQHFFRSSSRIVAIKNCITKDNTKPFRDDNGSCVLVTTKTKYPIFIVAVDQSLCTEATPYHWTTDSARNLYQEKAKRISETCHYLNLCMGTLKKEDHRIIETVSNILKDLNTKENLTQMKSEAQNNKEISFEVKIKIQKDIDKIEKALRTCAQKEFSSADKEIPAMLALRQDLEKMTSTLENDTNVYHWFDTLLPWAGFDGKFEEDSIVARTYAKTLQGHFFSNDRKGGTGLQGRGLYASRSLTATKSYGKNVLKITLPKGAQYLDLNSKSPDGGSIPLSPTTVTLLKKVGCNLDIYHYIAQPDSNIKNVAKASFSSNPHCREIFNKVIKSLDVKFLSYLYNPVEVSICPRLSKAAFVLIDLDFNSKNIKSYTYANEAWSYAEEIKIPDDFPKNLRDDFAIANQKYFEGLPKEEQERLRREKKASVYQCD